MDDGATFYLLTRFNSRDIVREIGLPDYSYKFVENYFYMSLAKLGNAVEISSVSQIPWEVNSKSYLFVFEPVHEVPEECLSNAIPVFAWEYNVLPDHESRGDKNYHWAQVLKQCRGAITHSSFTVRSMNDAGLQIPKTYLHVPIYEQYSQLPQKYESTSWSLITEGLTWDSATHDSMSLDKWEYLALVPSRKVIEFTEVVYTYVFNPLDGRKRWEDAASGFVWAHRGNVDAVLILKVVYKDQSLAFKEVLNFLRKLGSFQCRIVVVGGFLSTENFHELIIHTDYVINTSCGEGQCLPLLEFMSAGTPAISPMHTAMFDYINDENSYVVEHSWSLVPWPNDDELEYRCLNYPIVWESLLEAFLKSYERRKNNVNKYLAMSHSAKEKMAEICSEEVFERKIIEFIEQL